MKKKFSDTDWFKEHIIFDFPEKTDEKTKQEFKEGFDKFIEKKLIEEKEQNNE
jgi:hypothetical protein